MTYFGCFLCQLLAIVFHSVYSEVKLIVYSSTARLSIEKDKKKDQVTHKITCIQSVSDENFNCKCAEMELFFVPTKWRHSFGQCPYVCSLSFRRFFWDFFQITHGRNSIQFVMLMSWFSSEWSRFLSRSVYFTNFLFNFHLVKRATFRFLQALDRMICTLACWCILTSVRPI